MLAVLKLDCKQYVLGAAVGDWFSIPGAEHLDPSTKLLLHQTERSAISISSWRRVPMIHAFL